MAIFSVNNIRIAGITAAVPSAKASNRSCPLISAEEAELLIRTTGIEERRIAGKDLCASDLCFEAAKALLEELRWDPHEVDALVFVTQTPDHQLPGNSMLLQDRLGLSHECMALDIHQGCAGYVYGLATLSGMMSASGLKKALLLVGDTITKLLDPSDKGTIPIFSDAGSATALEWSDAAELMHFHLQTNGAKSNAICMQGSGSRKDEPGDPFMRMRGHDIFTFGLKEVAPNIESLLQYCRMEKNEIDYFVFHQANLLLNESIRKKLDIAPEKVPYTLQNYGNTSCATIPLTLVDQVCEQAAEDAKRVVLSGFGVGLSWGSAVVSLQDLRSRKLIEIDE